jgi:hypothetical protein
VVVDRSRLHRKQLLLPVVLASARSLLLNRSEERREAAEKVSLVIDTFQAEWLKNAEGAKRYYSLMKMRDLETRGAASAATKLRLTNQARYTPQAASTASRNAAKGLKPWEI